MPKIVVSIEYDKPEIPYWLNPDSVQLCLESECKNTRFKVRWAEGGDPWDKGGGCNLDSCEPKTLHLD